MFWLALNVFWLALLRLLTCYTDATPNKIHFVVYISESDKNWTSRYQLIDGL